MRQPIQLLLIALFIICGIGRWLSPASVSADIYRYVDRDGVMHFTNAPTSSKYRVYIKDPFYHQVQVNDPDQFDPFIDRAASFHGVAFPLLKAVIRAESAFDPKAVSRKGALGLMQIMPQNLEPFRVDDPFDPLQNIMGGAKYLKDLIRRFDGQIPLALAAYNAGPQAVDLHQGIPPFEETETYVNRVMRFLEQYRR
jgi:soluble lytic murein transglycosylase